MSDPNQPPALLHSRAFPALLCLLFAAIPFLAVDLTPIVDLPQQTAQVQMAFGVLDGSRPDLAILWGTPNKLSYALIAACWLVAPGAAAGRLAMLALVLLWIASFHTLAYRRGRSPVAATLASLLAFNHCVYWGLYSYLVGVPLFVGWMLLVSPRRPMRAPWIELPLVLGCAALLFYAHALWFAVALLWLGLISVVFRPGWRPVLWRALATLPVLLLALRWFAWLQRSGFGSRTMWGPWPWERLLPNWLVDAVLGGLRGPVELVLVALCLSWMALSVWTHRRRLRAHLDAELLLAGALFTAAALCLPILYTNTMFFAERWAPLGLAMLLLAIPAATWRAPLQQAAALVVVAFFALFTATQWIHVEVVELSGLQKSIDALPPGQRVLGLDHLVRSPTLKPHRPFLQAFAYAQLAKDSELSFSFADFTSCLVVYFPPREHPWTWELEWFPNKATDQDFLAFGHVIVGAVPARHADFAARPYLEPVTGDGLWRLYRVRHHAASAGDSPDLQRPP